MKNSELLGVYTFQHAGGEFDVHLRSQERFFAPEFQARASWHTNLEGDAISIDWGKFGKYEMKLTDAETRAFSGSLVGKPESWRKMFRRRPFTVAEEKLMDSKWTLTHPKGSFEIEFRADGFNHFICEEFPAHSHWKLYGKGDSPTPTLYVNWGKYGEYELQIAEDGESMSGSAKGQPDNWRKAQRIGELGHTAEAHVHDH